MKFIERAFEVKELSESGTFEGLASVYGNVDLGQDIVEPGAFKEFVMTQDGQVVILNAHNTREPVGKGKVTDTHLGLAIKGRLNLAVARARDVYEMMKDGVIRGLSIGFDILPNGAEIDEKGIRHLKALKLWEVSTTVFPLNEAAKISSVKELERVTSIREVEDWLRDAVGLSRAQAKLHAGAIWQTKTGQRDADGEVREEAQQLIEALASFGRT